MTQVNIVVETDGTVRIAGLGSASTLLDTPDAPTKADDILAFGIVAWEARVLSRSHDVRFPDFRTDLF